MSNKNKDESVKTCMGMPMRWESKNMLKNLWNPEDDRVFPPKYFGIGWDLNFHALFKKSGLVKNSKSNSGDKE